MCRLFALHSDQPTTADAWLLHAPYSLLDQSRFNADGTGLGWIDETGTPRIRKRPVAAFASKAFPEVATTLRSRAMLAHLRLSSGTGNVPENTHPFLQDGIICAHNGVLEVTDALRARVAELGSAHHVHGTTDSEWLAALITGEVAAHSGDLRAGTIAALAWAGANTPAYSLNVLVMKGLEMVGVRYPEANELWILEPGDRGVGPGSADGPVRSVVLASEPLDDDPAWRALGVGELVHIAADGTVTAERPFAPLAHQLHLEDLGLSAAASQAHAAQTRAHEERRRRAALAGQGEIATSALSEDALEGITGMAPVAPAEPAVAGV